MHFDPIGIVVADLSLARSILEVGCGVNFWTDEYSDAIIDVPVQLGRDAKDICYELIAPLSSNSPVLRAQRQGTNITNHLAFKLPSLGGSKAGSAVRGSANPILSKSHKLADRIGGSPWSQP